jgi:hypothetical protein
MKTKNTQLTAALIEDICMRLKAGSFDKVAVESAGVSWKLYRQWLRQADKPGCRGLYRQLADAVTQARAQARLRAEMEVREKDAKAWLLQGPGRETGTEQGWGAAGKSANAATPDNSARLFELCAVVLKALAAFPEARANVAEALARWQDQPTARKAARGKQ